MKHAHNKFIALAVAFVAAVVLAMPVTALAGQFKTSDPQSRSYSGKAYHFKSTVTDENNTELVEGTDFIRQYYYTSDYTYNASNSTPWDDPGTSNAGYSAAGFVFENIKGIGKYKDYATNTVRHNIQTVYQLKLGGEKYEGADDPSLASLTVLNNNPNDPLKLTDFMIDRVKGEDPAKGGFDITCTTNPEMFSSNPNAGAP